MNLDRRTFLKAAGVSLMLPHLESEAASHDKEIKNLSIKWSLQRGNRTGRTGWQFIIQLASDRNLQLNF